MSNVIKVNKTAETYEGLLVKSDFTVEKIFELERTSLSQVFDRQ